MASLPTVDGADEGAQHTRIHLNTSTAPGRTATTKVPWRLAARAKSAASTDFAATSRHRLVSEPAWAGRLVILDHKAPLAFSTVPEALPRCLVSALDNAAHRDLTPKGLGRRAAETASSLQFLRM